MQFTTEKVNNRHWNIEAVVVWSNMYRRIKQSGMVCKDL